MGDPKFKTFSIATALHKKILEFIKAHPEYRSPNDLVSEAVRLRMDEIEKLDLQKGGESQ